MLARRQRLGTALADAFLAGAWDGEGLRSGAFLVLGQRHRWARELAAQVLAAYPRRPADRPHELAEFVRNSPVLDEVQRRSSRRRRPFPVPLHRITEPTTMVSRRFPVKPIDNAGDLAELLGLTMADLLWFADAKGLQRRASVAGLHHYRSRWVRTAAGGARLLEAPLPRLRTIQRQLLDQVLAPIPVHEAAHGFVTGRSVRTGAQPHVGAVTVVSLDLESLFASITGGRIYGILRSAGYPEPVAHLLTGLCTQATAVRVLLSMPPTRDGTAAFRLRRHLAAPHLPQGAPTSPQLANLAAFRLDRRLASYAGAVGTVYTRYADDLTFSGSDVRPRGIIAAVGRIVREEGFSLNAAKTRTRSLGTRRQVTGVVVNTTTRVPREQYELLRAILHNCVVHGPETQNRLPHSDFRRICGAGSRGSHPWTVNRAVGCWTPSSGSPGTRACLLIRWSAARIPAIPSAALSSSPIQHRYRTPRPPRRLRSWNPLARTRMSRHAL